MCRSCGGALGRVRDGRAVGERVDDLPVQVLVDGARLVVCNLARSAIASPYTATDGSRDAYAQGDRWCNADREQTATATHSYSKQQQ